MSGTYGSQTSPPFFGGFYNYSVKHIHKYFKYDRCREPTVPRRPLPSLVGFIIQSVKHIHKYFKYDRYYYTEIFLRVPSLKPRKGALRPPPQSLRLSDLYLSVWNICVRFLTEYIIGNLPCRAEGAAIRVFSSVLQEYFIWIFDRMTDGCYYSRFFNRPVFAGRLLRHINL
jgi:hypothetical protein